MPDKEDFERLKTDFLEKNMEFAKAVKQTTTINFRSINNKVRVLSLRSKAVESYHILLNYMKTAQFQNK